MSYGRVTSESAGNAEASLSHQAKDPRGKCKGLFISFTELLCSQGRGLSLVGSKRAVGLGRYRQPSCSEVNLSLIFRKGFSLRESGSLSRTLFHELPECRVGWDPSVREETRKQRPLSSCLQEG